MEQARIARSNADDAYQAIRKLIVTVELPPGSSCTEGELVKRIGLGKTPVREALLRLKLENLIAVQPRSGYRIAPVTFKDVRDACRLLGYLEAQAAGHAAASAGSAPLELLQAQVEHGGASDEKGETSDSWIRADWHFHLGLARCQDNQLQVETMTKLNQLILRFRYLAMALGVDGSPLTHRHDHLLDAIGRADSSGAAAAAGDLWRETETGLVGLLSETESVRSANLWNGSDKNSFYLDAIPPGPAIPEVFEPGLTKRTPSAENAPRRAADQEHS